jgi:hypothetical protein
MEVLPSELLLKVDAPGFRFPERAGGADAARWYCDARPPIGLRRQALGRRAC